MRNIYRRSAPEVKLGQVRKKNNWGLTANYYVRDQQSPVIDRKRPGKGYRHVLKQKDVRQFIGILPDWKELSAGLNAIVLAPGNYYAWGYHVRGVVHVCAWDEDLWVRMSPEGYEMEREILERLRVPCERRGRETLCKFNECTARAHQLLATLLHELGHHHDRMSTRSRARVSRGESYAEAYAREYAGRIWSKYLEVFDLY